MILKPGIYKATVRGVPDQIVMVGKEYAHTVVEVEDFLIHWPSDHITDARPLIVLDLGDKAPDVVKALRVTANRPGRVGDSSDVHWLANKIEAQTKPPRIPEPGLWGVVEAGDQDSRRYYFHESIDTLGWVGMYGRIRWSDLIDPVLIRPGIEAQS